MTMRLYVPLTRDDFERLLDQARQERRRPQDQASVLLSRALADIVATPPRRPVEPIDASSDADLAQPGDHTVGHGRG